MRNALASFGVIALLGTGFGLQNQGKVGEQADGSTLVPTAQTIQSAGQTLRIPGGRPLDFAVSPNRQYLFVKDHRGLVVVDPQTKQIVQQLAMPGNSSYLGIQAARDGSVWLTNAGSRLRQATRVNGQYRFTREIAIPNAGVGGNPHPCGFALYDQEKMAAVTASRGNRVHLIELASGRVTRSINVDACPIDIAISPDQRTAWVTCWGGPPPATSDKKQKSSGTDIAIDQRGVAKSASVVQVNLQTGAMVGRVLTGLQPTEIVISRDGKRAYVANANADTVSVIDTASRRSVATINTKPEERVPFGSMPSGLMLSADGSRLYIANGGANSVAVYLTRENRILGHIPTGWYPVAIAQVGNDLWVANAKGLGSREKNNNRYGVYGFTGTLSAIPVPTQSALRTMTPVARRQAGINDALEATLRGQGTAAKVVPTRYNEPSKIKHVVYIVKENRTYDQVFGDLPQGDGDPNLCMYPREVTPNHHALAEQFVLLDNYYCNGVLSADGHAWAMEGIATTNFERSFGGWTRSYPFGDDPLAVATTGFIWDHMLGAGKSFRNYGEFDYATPVPSNSTFKQIYDDYVAKTNKIRFNQNIGVERLRSYSHRATPGWNMRIPDVLRADSYLEHFRTLETMPALTILYYPQDHTSGTTRGEPTPRACMADNDLAIGRVVEALSKSRFWKDMAIFINEDDPQDGFDHVDGHRTVCLVISPYTKRGQVVSQFYNQTSVLHTICRMLNVAPMNQMVAASRPMSECFTETPNLAPYTALPNNIPLDELNGSSEMTAMQKWAEDASAKLDFSKPDGNHEDLLNRILWHDAFGDKPYPKHQSGAHGTGLKSRGLKFSERGIAEDDD